LHKCESNNFYPLHKEKNASGKGFFQGVPSPRLARVKACFPGGGKWPVFGHFRSFPEAPHFLDKYAAQIGAEQAAFLTAFEPR
jgi:hypothetical protein